MPYLPTPPSRAEPDSSKYAHNNPLCMVTTRRMLNSKAVQIDGYLKLSVDNAW
jgi:hypothetical protein